MKFYGRDPELFVKCYSWFRWQPTSSRYVFIFLENEWEWERSFTIKARYLLPHKCARPSACGSLGYTVCIYPISDVRVLLLFLLLLHQGYWHLFIPRNRTLFTLFRMKIDIFSSVPLLGDASHWTHLVELSQAARWLLWHCPFGLLGCFRT